MAASAARTCVRKPRVFRRLLRATPWQCLTTRSDPVRTAKGPGPPALAPPCVGVCAWLGRAKELTLQAGGTHLCGDTAGGASGLALHWGPPCCSPVLGSPSAQAVLSRLWFLRTTGSNEGLVNCGVTRVVLCAPPQPSCTAIGQGGHPVRSQALGQADSRLAATPIL